MPAKPMRLAALTLGASIGASLCTASASAQETTSREIVQPLPSKDVQRLNRALLRLAKRPQSVEALLDAGDASIKVGDLDAAIGFFRRAQAVSPNNAQVLLGLAKVYLQAGRPVEALPFFNNAQSAGADATDVLSDRGLAFDMVGDHASAQASYQRASALDKGDKEAQRRLALSYAISGNRAGFEETLRPLLDRRDFASFRTRAFGLAILGDQKRAAAIVDAVMPRDLALRINPYLEFMPRLTKPQQAAAANLGIFPQAADIGREDPTIAAFANAASSTTARSARAAESRLEPSGPPLGDGGADAEKEADAAIETIPAKALAQDTASAGEPARVAEAVPETASVAVPVVASAPAAVEEKPEPQPVQPVRVARGGDGRPQANIVQLRELPSSRPSAATSGSQAPASQTPANPVQTPEPGFDLARFNDGGKDAAKPQPPAKPEAQPRDMSVASAFADLGAAPSSTAPTARDAVDISAIKIPRETVEEPEVKEPETPAHPSRIWVQLATGRDVSALGFDWRRFSRKAGGLLDKYKPHVGAWGQTNRLLAGPLDSRAAARDLAAGLKARGIDTLRYTSGEDTEIKQIK